MSLCGALRAKYLGRGFEGKNSKYTFRRHCVNYKRIFKFARWQRRAKYEEQNRRWVVMFDFAIAELGFKKLFADVTKARAYMPRILQSIVQFTNVNFKLFLGIM